MNKNKEFISTFIILLILGLIVVILPLLNKENNVVQTFKNFDPIKIITNKSEAKVKNHEQKVEVTIPLKKFILRAEESREDLYAAIDVVVDKIERQIRKNKTKLQSKKIKERDITIDYVEDIDDEDNKVVKRKTIEVKPMSEEEAIIQMELLGHSFYLFKDATSSKPTLVYKREDGNYGVIETE